MLSGALVSHLPDSVNPDECTALLSVKSGMNGSFGETHFIGHKQSLLVLTRASSIGAFDVFTLPPDRLPTVEGKSWRSKLHVVMEDGEVHALELSEEERVKAARMLEQLYRTYEAWAPLATLMRARIDDKAGSDRLDELMQLGDIYRERIGSADDAYACYAEAFDNQSFRDNAISGMERILDGGQLIGTIAPIVEEHYRRGHKPKKLAWLLGIKAPTLPGRSERAAAYSEAAKLTRQIDELADALAFAGKALVETPESNDVVRAFDQLAEQTSGWEQSLEFLEAALARADLPDEVRHELLSRITSRCVDKLARWERAESAARALLEIDGKDALGWRALDATYTALERWTALAEVLDQRAAVSARAEQIELLYRLGCVCAEELGDLDRACVSLYRVLDVDPSHDDSFCNLEAIHRTRNELDELRELLSRWLEVQTDAPKRVDTLATLAGVCEQLEDLTAAIDAWRRLLAHQAGHTGALENLVRLHRLAQLWPGLVDALLALARATESNRLALFCEAAEVVANELADPARSLEIYLEAHSTGAVDRTVLDKICELATQLGRHEELVAVLRELLALDSLAVDDVATYRMALGDALIALDELDDAIQVWHQVLADEPTSTRALGTLHQLYAKTEQWASLTGIIRRRLELSTDDGDKVEQLIELAELYEHKLDDADSAANTYTEALDLAPDNEPIALRLVDTLTALQAWPRLMDLHKNRGNTLAVAAVLEQRLDQPDRAFQWLLSALRRDWRDERVATEVARLAKATVNEQKVISELEAELAELPTEHKAELCRRIDSIIKRFESNLNDDVLRLRIGEHYETARSDYGAAAKRYRAVGKPLRIDAMYRLRKTLRNAEAWAELARHLEDMAQMEQLSSRERRTIYRELVPIYTDKLDEPVHAEQAERRSKSAAPALILLVLVMTLGGAAYYYYYW